MDRYRNIAGRIGARLGRAAALAFVLLALAPSGAMSQASTSPLGDWQTIDDATGRPRSIVHVWERDGLLFGTITKLIDPPRENPVCGKCEGALRDRPVLGTVIMEGLRKHGAEWNGGTILDPASGKTYRVLLEVEDGGRILKVRGYRGISLLGRTQRWQRVR